MTVPVEAENEIQSDYIDYFDTLSEQDVGELNGRRISQRLLSDFYEKVKQKTHALCIQDERFHALAAEFVRNFNVRSFSKRCIEALVLKQGISESTENTSCEQTIGLRDSFDFGKLFHTTGNFDERQVTKTSHIEPKIQSLFQEEEALQAIITEFVQSCNQSWFIQKGIERLQVGKTIPVMGFFKDIGKFWKKHKVAILVGTGVAAAVGTIIVVTVFTGGVGAGVAAAAAGAAADKIRDSQSKNNTPNTTAKAPPPPPEPPPANVPPPIPLPSITDGLWINGQFYPYMSDQKASDLGFIANLPTEFRHNLAIHSIANIPLPHNPWAPKDKPELMQNPIAKLIFGANARLEQHPRISDPSFLPTPPHVLQAIGKEIVNNPWLLNPDPKPTLKPTTPLGEALTIIQTDLVKPDEVLPVELPWYKKAFSSVTDVLETIGQGILEEPLIRQETDLIIQPDVPVATPKIEVQDPSLLPPLPSSTTPWYSKAFSYAKEAFLSSNKTIVGSLPDYNRMSLINGMNTLETTKDSHVAYISNLAPQLTMDCVYNRTHNVEADVAEIFALNYRGISPNTADLLIENWTQYHEKFIDNPHVKYFQICHSQGALHVRNALMKAPPEIRNRVIVLAIAPAAVVSKDLCYKSFNYACSSDIVPNGELLHGILEIGKLNPTPLVEAIKHRQELILLKGPPGFSLNHNFQNPIFKDKINEHIQDYLTTNGNYQ